MVDVLPEDPLDEGSYRHQSFLVTFSPGDLDSTFCQTDIANVDTHQFRDSDA